MGVSGGGGSTQIDVPPQIGQIGQTTSNIGAFEANFLGEPLSLGNWGVTMATGGSVPQIASTGYSSMAQDNPAQYNLNTGAYWQGSVNDPNTWTGAGYSGTIGQTTAIGEGGGTQYSSGQMTGGGVPTPTANVGGQNYYIGQTIQYSAGQSYTALYDASGNRVGYRNADGNFVDSTPQLDGATPKQINVAQPGGQRSAQGAQPAAPGGGYFNTGSRVAPGTTQVGGISTPTQNPLYGPWINSAISAMAAEAGQAPSYEQMIAQAEGYGRQYAGYAGQEQAASQGWLKQGQQIVGRGQSAFEQGAGVYGQGVEAFKQGQGMVTEATTGTGLFPSQQALVNAQVKSGQAQIRQQLASEGLSSSTLGPELSAEIGLQGAATAGQLIQGNIAAGVSQEQAGIGLAGVGIGQEQAGTGLIQAGTGVAGVGVNLQQAAQGWGQLATSQQALGFGEQQALTGLFQNLASQNQGMQNQLWQQGLQGYGMEGAFLNSALSSYGTSLQAYNSILQASEAQAQINEQLTASANAANAAIIGAAISAVGEIGGGAAKACWLARAVIPERWTLFRVWLLGRAPKWIRAWYLQHGEASAIWIKNRPIAKWFVRWIMNTILDISYGRRRRWQ